MARFFDLTPAERNRIRHLRDLLDAYERNPASSLIDAIQREARELANVGHVAIRDRQETQRANAADALRHNYRQS